MSGRGAGTCSRRTETVDVDHRLGKGLRGFLRQIVPDAARDNPVRVFARKLFGIGRGVRVRGTIGITFKGDRGHRDDRKSGKPPFKVVVFRFAFSLDFSNTAGASGLRI